MQRARHLVLPLTLFGLCFLVFPPLDVLFTTMPIRPRDVGWRFGSEGLLSGSILYPLIGLLMLMGAAVIKDTQMRARVMTWVSGLFCVALLVLVGAFVLDAVQLRASVPAKAASSFDRSTLLALLRDGAAFIVSVGYFIAARRMSKDLSRTQAKAGSPGIGAPVVGMRSRAAEVPAVSDTV
jgi:hypothetical protein